LDDWIYCTLYIHTVRDYRQLQHYRYSTHFQLTVAQALGFSVFTCRILATDLSQSHCNFNSHMKSSWDSLIPFLPFLQLAIPKTRLDYPRLLFYTPLYSVFSAYTTFVLPSYNHFPRTPRKTPSSIVKNSCLLVRYLAIDVLLFRAFASAGMSLSTRCLAMDTHVTKFLGNRWKDRRF
jgi:hypothetical protein